MRKRTQVLVGILLSFLFLWLAFRKVNFGEVGQALSNGNYLFFAAAFFLGGAGFLIRTLRWRILLFPIKDISFGNAFSALTIGFMANGILPLRLGEIVRALVIGYNEKISKSAALATIVVERMLDVFVLLFLFSGFLIVIPLPPIVKKISALVFLIGLFAVGFLFFIALKPNLIMGLFNFLPGRFNQKLRTIVISFIEGLKIINSWKRLALVIILSICFWSYVAFIYYTVFQVLGIELPLYAAFIVMIITSLGICIPSAPGFVGTFHYFVILGLSIFGIPKDIALSYAILIHLISFLPVVLIGFLCLQKMGLTLRKLSKTKII